MKDWLKELNKIGKENEQHEVFKDLFVVEFKEMQKELKNLDELYNDSYDLGDAEVFAEEYTKAREVVIAFFGIKEVKK